MYSYTESLLSLFFYLIHVVKKKKSRLDRERALLRPKCKLTRDVMLGWNPSCPALDRLPLTLNFCLFLSLLFALLCLVCCLWSERSIPPTHTHTISLYYLLYHLSSSATWWKETTWDFWEWVKLIVRVQKFKVKTRMCPLLTPFFCLFNTV